jgi:hypothetical protein
MISRIFVYLFIYLFAGGECMAQVKAVYTMFLEEPVPANGVSVTFNAPILRWPFQKGKQVKYDAALSMDSVFTKGRTIAAAGLQGAIFNPHQALATGKWYWHYRVAGKEWSPLQYRGRRMHWRSLLLLKKHLHRKY